MKNKEKDRQLELSHMFLQMGQSLFEEGTKNRDYVTTQCGLFLTLLSGIVLSKEDVYVFTELTSMFSAKKVLEGMEKNGNPFLDELKKRSDAETYEDIIKRINKLMGGLGPDSTKE